MGLYTWANIYTNNYLTSECYFFLFAYFYIMNRHFWETLLLQICRTVNFTMYGKGLVCYLKGMRAHTCNKVIKHNLDRFIDVCLCLVDIFWTMEYCILQRSTIPCVLSLLSLHFIFIKLLKVCPTDLYWISILFYCFSSPFLDFRDTSLIDPWYLEVGETIIGSLNYYTKVDGGFASVRDVSTMKLEDHQHSFFLSET